MRFIKLFLFLISFVFSVLSWKLRLIFNLCIGKNNTQCLQSSALPEVTSYFAELDLNVTNFLCNYGRLAVGCAPCLGTIPLLVCQCLFL